MQRQLRDNPGLKSELDEILADAYRTAILLAAEETGLMEDEFPRACPYEFDDAMTRPIHPTEA